MLLLFQFWMITVASEPDFLPPFNPPTPHPPTPLTNQFSTREPAWSFGKHWLHLVSLLLKTLQGSPLTLGIKIQLLGPLSGAVPQCGFCNSGHSGICLILHTQKALTLVTCCCFPWSIHQPYSSFRPYPSHHSFSIQAHDSQSPVQLTLQLMSDIYLCDWLSGVPLDHTHWRVREPYSSFVPCWISSTQHGVSLNNKWVHRCHLF